MPRQALALVSVLSLLLIVLPAPASAVSPALNLILPRGVQRGTEVVLTFSGARLGDAEEILFYQPGMTVSKIEADNENRIKATVTVAPDCRLGEHVCQVRTASGISDYRSVYVGALPVVEEKEPNTEFDAAQPIALNTTVHGIITSEDVDHFVVEAKKGQRISVEVEGMRLGATFFDPYIAILDSKRFELAAEDDTTLLVQDAAASVIAPEDGKYVIQVRESSYGGNGNSRYCLHIGTFPRPTAVYPAGGKMGEGTEVTFLGDPAGDIVQQVTVPSQSMREFGLFASDAGGIAPSDNPFRPFEHGNVLEIEPNNDFATATPAELPLAFNGIISEPGDVDIFRFSAKKGQVWEVECYARRIRSSLDPVMNLYHADGKSIAGNDDSRGPDSYIRFTAPADGEYAVRVTDHLGRGDKDFVYRIEFTPVTPHLTLGIPRVTRYGQERQQIVIARGNRYGTVISASRTNFGGDLVLDGANLPEGVTMHAEPMPGNQNSMPVVFEASADAPVAGGLIDFTARHADPKQKISGGFANKADFIISAPGQSLYRSCEVDKLPIAVVDELPFQIEIVEPKVPLTQNGSMQLKVIAHREEGFTAPITVEFPFRPPGVGTVPNVTIPEGKSEVLYPLNANGNAPVGKWRVYALGHADIDGGESKKARRRGRAGRGHAFASSQLATLEVAAPYVQFAMERAATEQGKPTEIVVKVTHDKPFEGQAKVQLVGLPHKVTTSELELTKEMSELIFKITTDAESPAGIHKNLFCQVTITENGEPIQHRAGSTELRIDKPLPPPKTKPKEPEPKQVAEKAKPEPKPEKRLSRLEQLRLEAKQQAADETQK